MNTSKTIFSILGIGALLATSACRETTDPDSVAQDAGVHAISIMTFNVENLFDNVDDPGKDDGTYLALTDKQNDEHRTACATIEVRRWRDQCLNWDWNEDIIQQKLQVIADAILQVDDGRGADIVALQEVENIGILERLRTDYLGSAEYLPAILVEGSDLRGIDVAFLSRLPLAGTPTLHSIPFEGIPEKRVADTRGILQADFLLPDETLLSGFAVHFPAPFHPAEMREMAYARLNRLLDALPADRPAFAAGDFNTTSSENAKKDLLGRLVRPRWTVAHEVGCEECPGTQYYAADGSWSFLDMILWSPGRNRGADATWAIRADSVQLANKTPAQVTLEGTPARFNLPEGSGVSDHWPLALMIETTNKQ
ncbi:MAG: endonuclease/exonuclease/phosphatase family protein [Gammaproteobacteria bacterium]|nr:endonuclease/exonuclease/phosphatase family protein [Gammaproteobacteria bacterium]MDH4314052.1 endonuclease/exonuclease/phosphatase family protein [Gammaproteobacteria bacterium]MDH5213508.1 endonuclease/exonuclease/phosphatase family protein [Gammaproteobacteria bacterium]MDH5502113.1 endonuclease/exonuclease/phosphatase family protein [Gammaproteobacteria bacterium]